jgi:hypothetical protein
MSDMSGFPRIYPWGGSQGVENPTIEVIKVALLKIIDSGGVSLYRMLLDVVDVEGVDSDGGYSCGSCGDFVYSTSLSV